MSQFTHLVYYYLNDLNQVHFACRGLPYGDMDVTLFIDDELNKAFRNPKWSGLFLKPFKNMSYPKTRYNG
jgi:hypothetical protein